MTRERRLLFVAVPVVFLAVFLLRQEYAHYYPAKSMAQLPDESPARTPIVASSSPSDARKVPEGVAAEDVPKNRSAEDDSVIAHAKNAPVNMLDSSLPHQSTGDWISHAAGGLAHVRWEVNNCPGAGKASDASMVCAQANVKFSNGTVFQALILLGERPQKSGPVQYAEPSLLWAAYQKTDGALTPASLDMLRRIAQEAG